MNPRLKAALFLAEHGLYVFPVNNPIIKDKECTGCTCEDYRRSEKCRETNPIRHLKAGKKCENPGKCPRVKWREQSTRDEATIIKWFSKPWGSKDVETGKMVWVIPNIGIDCGKSGILVFDADTYKKVCGDVANLLPAIARETITVISGGGGEHYWYRLDGKDYGNSTKGLPPGFDIRGDGGYVVAPGSMHKSGQLYTFEDGYGVGEIAALSIPEALEKILNTANRTIRKAGAQVVPSAIDVKRSMQRAEQVINLLGSETVSKEWQGGVVYVFTHCPFNPVDDPHAEDRTGNITIGSDGAISAGCHHGRCQHVIADSKLSGWHLLKQMAGIEPKEKEADAFHNLLAAARNFGRTTSFAPFIPASFQAHIYHKNVDGSRGELLRVDYRTDSTDTKVYDALLDMAALAHNFTVYCSLETGRDIAGVGSKATFKAAIERLIAAGLIERNNTAKASDLAQTYRICIDFVLRRLNASIKEQAICVQSTQYENRKATDPFLSGRSQHAKREGLGEGFLRIMDVLADGRGWERLELADETGKKAGGLGRLLKRGEDLGLIYSERETPRSPKVYYLSPDAWEKVEALTPTLKTYKLRAERKERFLEGEQNRTDVRLDMAAQPKTVEHYAIRRSEIIAARRRYLAVIHPEWTDEDILKWILTPKPTATPHLDRQEKKFEAEAKSMHKQGITPPQAQAYAELAGWTRGEAASIADRVERLSGGNYAQATAAYS
jgi:DNA-binding MarR family transcriptional regulator